MSELCFLISVVAFRDREDGNLVTRHQPGVLVATSAEQASSRALDWARELYPDRDGWYGHSTAVSEIRLKSPEGGPINIRSIIASSKPEDDEWPDLLL